MTDRHHIRLWFGINAVVIVGSLAMPWTAATGGAVALSGYAVVVFAAFVIPALPDLLAGRVFDPVTLSDAWLGVSVACGWLGAIGYLTVIGTGGVRAGVARACVALLLIAIAAADFSTFASLSRSVELAWGFGVLCISLGSSMALEATSFLTAKERTLEATSPPVLGPRSPRP